MNVISYRTKMRIALEHHVRGTNFGIGVDDQDGLLRASAEGSALYHDGLE
jgi:hypothetical protein